MPRDSEDEKLSKLMAGRVMSRLMSRPIYMTQTSMALIWGIDVATVGQWVRAVRGY